MANNRRIVEFFESIKKGVFGHVKTVRITGEAVGANLRRHFKCSNPNAFGGASKFGH